MDQLVLKFILKLLLKGSATFGVGEIANILVGVALVTPAAWLYNRNKSKKSAITGMVVGALVMQLVGIIANIYFLLPAYGIEVDLTKYVFVGLIPFNGIKALIVCIGTFILYKRLSMSIFKVDSRLGDKRNVA